MLAGSRGTGMGLGTFLAPEMRFWLYGSGLKA